ncbi:MAG TPA: TolC family protein [Sediminibacterium sp.]|nr:TolC family protein [Sediminibacterium sp.]
MIHKIINGKMILLFLVMNSFMHMAVAQTVLTLDEAKVLAIKQNNNLKMADQYIAAARAAKEGAGVAGKPKIDGSANGFYFGSPLNKILPEYGASVGLGVTQPIYAGGKVKLGIETAAKLVEIQESRKVLTTAEVLFNVEKAYWQAVNANDKIKLVNKNISLTKAILNDLNNLYVAGIIYKNDVLRAQVQLNDAELNLVKATDGLTLAKLNLAQLTGMGDSTNFVINDSITGNFKPSEKNVYEALNKRPEITLLNKSIEVQQLQKKLLQADSKPSVGIGLNVLGAAGKQGINPTNTSNVLGSYYGLVSVSVPIFDWGGRKSKINEQSYKIAAQQTQLAETQQLITVEVQQAYLQLGQSAKRIDLAITSLQQAEENLRLTNDRFKAGTVVGKDLLEAQTIWEQANSNLIDAKVEYRINEAALKKAMGE